MFAAKSQSSETYLTAEMLKKRVNIQQVTAKSSAVTTATVFNGIA